MRQIVRSISSYADEICCTTYGDVTSGVLVVNTGEAASAGFNRVEASVDLTVEELDTRTYSVLEEDADIADSDKDENEDMNGGGRVVLFSISSSMTISLLIMESLLDLGVITCVELIDGLGVGRLVVR